MGRQGAIFDPVLRQEAVYKCTQSSTDPPAIAYTLKNTVEKFITAPVFAYTSPGLYTLTKTGAFTTDKTVVVVQSANAAARVCNIVYTSANVVTFTWMDAATPTAAESGAFDLYIYIYN